MLSISSFLFFCFCCIRISILSWFDTVQIGMVMFTTLVWFIPWVCFDPLVPGRLELDRRCTRGALLYSMGGVFFSNVLVISCAALMLIIALGSVTTGGWAAMIHPEYNRSEFEFNLLVVAVVHSDQDGLIYAVVQR
ncbi:hypothetical protein ASPBRDRAFT_584367 [Aspergillus brasiliensis CBS 101740]|uniref:Uncharacterized protein n=1 Tax=Aspergillus brasiliensis (strain CBS 101740 / IMI 381727 / IBT 21946) TaxID=767769 RepID=A0A1L9UJX5_ASPBC|nr:hypothetical protein ASPBRDRAFT_584367 [Aspergillus brasiliensis CBS 101740]